MEVLLQQAVEEGALRAIDKQFALFIAPDQPLLALIVACLSTAMSEGHVCLDLNSLQKDLLFYGQYPELTEKIWHKLEQPDLSYCQKLLRSHFAVSDGSQPTPLVLRENRLYIQRLWQDELTVAQFFATPKVLPINNISLAKSTLDSFFAQDEHELNWQKVAAAVALTSTITIISGGPGTGKTSTVARLLATLVRLNSDKLRIHLAAPTGKAASRLTESLNTAIEKLLLNTQERSCLPTQATTLHQLLGMQINSVGCRYHRQNRLCLDVLVIDEASMIDLSIMAHLVNALPDNIRLILLGDHEQLSSVEAGTVMGDLCYFSAEYFSRQRAQILQLLTGYAIPFLDTLPTAAIRDSLVLLQKSYRFASHSGIGQLAYYVNRGQSKEAIACLTNRYHDIELCTPSQGSYQDIINDCITQYRDYLLLIQRRATPIVILEAFFRFQLLCALRKGHFGVEGLNRCIEQGLYRARLIDFHPVFNRQWYAGRPIIIERNDSRLGLFNGDIGITLYDEQDRLRVYFPLADGSVKSIQPNRLPQHQTVYAMTVHKSQGSEFERVLLIFPDIVSPILSRELLYTAITRAKKFFKIYTSSALFCLAVDTPTQRFSGMVQHLQAQADLKPESVLSTLMLDQ